MSDLISRQAAIDALNEYFVRIGKLKRRGLTKIEKVIRLDMVGTIETLPSEQQWIPCSERLPEIGEHYVSEPCIVYCSNGAYGFAELEENIFGQVGWDCERDDEYHEPLGEVIAWMPLPEPWKGEDDERA